MKKFDVIVVGAGLFGVSAALKLAQKYKVLLIEKNFDILREASFVNQNRVHFGFHYPRSFETALESLDGYELFKQKFHPYMRNFENYYAIVANGSLTSAHDFLNFSSRLRQARNVEYKEVAVDAWFFHPGVASTLLQVHEPVIDMAQVRESLRKEIINCSQLTLMTNTSAQELSQENPFVLKTTQGVFQSDFLVNASFGNLSWHNHPQAHPAEIQLVEMVEVECDKALPGITLMDGPGCFGVLPIGFQKNRYWWYSVAYSVHMRTETQKSMNFRPPLYSNWDRMKIQAEHYFTFMRDVKFVRSHFTPRTLLLGAKVEQTAARPSVITQLAPNFYQVLSGKLTTCLKVAEEVNKKITHGAADAESSIGDSTHIKKAA